MFIQVLIDGGKVQGDIFVSKLTLRGHATVLGSITCKSLSLEPHVVSFVWICVHSMLQRVLLLPDGPISCVHTDCCLFGDYKIQCQALLDLSVHLQSIRITSVSIAPDHCGQCERAP